MSSSTRSRNNSQTWMLLIGSMLCAFGLGINIPNVLMKHTAGITIGAARAEIMKCESTLPRDQKCYLIAIPKE